MSVPLMKGDQALSFHFNGSECGIPYGKRFFEYLGLRAYDLRDPTSKNTKGNFQSSRLSSRIFTALYHVLLVRLRTGQEKTARPESVATGVADSEGRDRVIYNQN